MGRFAIGTILGLLLGGVITFFTFVGVPKAAQAPGEPIKPPDPSSSPGAAQIVLSQDFFNEVLGAIFRDMQPPAFPLAAGERGADGFRYERAQAGGCDGTIKLLPEGSGVRTGVKLENNAVTAPLAFTGSYNSMLGCYQFTGWAQANLELRYDAGQQAVFGRINVETVNLDGVNPLVSGIVTPLVQNSINGRVNPIQILRGEQLALGVPITSAGGALRANVSDVRSEIKNNAMHLYLIYGFSGAAAGQQPPV
jgi:hypothetical protein